jgi:hypothetical protein
MELALSSELPAAAYEYKNSKKRLLVALCHQLQLFHGSDQPFFLACRKAGELLGVNYALASRWLKQACSDGVLRLIREHPREDRLGNEYLFLWDLTRWN